MTKGQYRDLIRESVEQGDAIFYHRLDKGVLKPTFGFIFDKDGAKVFTAISETGEFVTMFKPGGNNIDAFLWRSINNGRMVAVVSPIP